MYLVSSGPFKINGVPLRRVNQSYVIATSTKVDVSACNVEKFDDKYFSKEVQKKKKKGEGEFFESEKEEKKTLPQDKKDDQKTVDSALIKAIESVPDLKFYLGARFSLKQGQKPHELMARTQKNKATAHHLGLLKAKLAKLRRELLTPSSKGAGGAGEGFDVTKSGDSRVGLVGFPSVGKSTLLNKLTGTFSEVASYEFTTLTCIPGVITYRGAKIQLLDLPGIIEGAKDGKGRGRQKDKGGINLTSTVTNTHLDLDTVKAICSEYKIHNADITLRYDATADDLIDVIEGSRVYMPCIYVVNKIDQITLEELEILDKLPHYCPISAHLEWNLDGLLEKIWEYLNLTRIYTKPKGMNPDYEDPVILSSKRRTVEDFCNRIHKDMLKHALVWGSSAKHKPQRVGKEHELEDEDVVQIIKKV
ncbi:hypothetical protein Ahy_B06g084108 isoform C [Arachis hypogaea]|uniref:60S ribosomal protein L6 n=1 Tax=Arachis hypogaea TaxID=3818 RepID=A0A444YR85_ARAHY|nr:hypothetical protein Ahy_B06g084108 isoform C [Arachis hypogaea]